MRVGLTAEQLRRRAPGGIGTYVRGLLRGLAELRASVDVETWDPPLPPSLMVRLWDKSLLRPPLRFDVVHATSLAVPPRTKKHAMSVMVHDLGWRALPDAYTARGRAWHEAALRRAIERADLLLTPSARVAAELVDEGVASSRVRVAPLGADGLPEPDHTGADSLLRQHGVEGAYLLTVGTLQPRKNLRRLFEAYTRARRLLQRPIPLVVVGSIGWGEQIDPVDGVVSLHGITDAQLSALYEGCTALLYVPLLEGFGLPVVEAMASGVPVLSSPVPSAGDAALIVDPIEVDAMTEGIVEICEDERLREGLVERGRAHVSALTWRETARVHVDAWTQL